MKRELVCVLIGVLLSSAAFMVRDAIREYQQLEIRVMYVEGYLAALDKMLRSGQ